MNFEVLQIRKSSYDDVTYWNKDFNKEVFDIGDYFRTCSSVVDATSSTEAIQKIIELFTIKANSRVLQHPITTSDIIVLDGGKFFYMNSDGEWVDITNVAAPQADERFLTRFDDDYVIYHGHYWD